MATNNDEMQPLKQITFLKSLQLFLEERKTHAISFFPLCFFKNNKVLNMTVY